MNGRPRSSPLSAACGVWPLEPPLLLSTDMVGRNVSCTLSKSEPSRVLCMNSREPFTNLYIEDDILYGTGEEFSAPLVEGRRRQPTQSANSTDTDEEE